MDKETLSNYGWVVCVILVLAIMISLATPFGSVIRDKVTGTVENFKNNSEEVLDNIGGASSFDDLGGGGSGGAGEAGGSGESGGTGGGEPACEHVDTNTDYHCDECGAMIDHEHEFPSWQTHKCRLCGYIEPHECVLSDSAKEMFEEMGYYDGDYRCALCRVTFEHTCVYEHSPYCDWCGETVDPAHYCEGEESRPGVCWICGEPLPPHECSEYDDDEDYVCDFCYAVLPHDCQEIGDLGEPCPACGEIVPHDCDSYPAGDGTCAVCGEWIG